MTLTPSTRLLTPPPPPQSYLYGDEVLLGSVARAVDVSHPVAGVSATIDEMTQLAFLEDLPHTEVNTKSMATSLVSRRY